MTQKLSQNQMSELKETRKLKVVQLHEYTPNQLLNPAPTPTPKIALYGWKQAQESLAAAMSLSGNITS